MRRAKVLFALVIALTAVAGTATGVAAATVGGARPDTPSGHVKPDPLTGYPTHINTINLNGYQIETSYPLGKLDAGSTYLQTYTGDSVTAVATKGPYVGSPAVTYKYIAMPVARHMLLLVWLEPDFKHNTFVYNLKTHISSVVTWDQQGDPSLGSVSVVKAGSHPIP
jgi:hypothetical protein